MDLIVRAEAGGVGTVWAVMPALGLDTPTLFAAALAKTERVTVGTAIVPAFTRHPLGLATQIRALEGLAPGRLRVGIGTAHARTMVDVYHLPFDRPLAQLREYLAVLRPALAEGTVSFAGEFYRVDATFPSAPNTPLLVSALRAPAFALAGELADGAISWLCPVGYLLREAIPAMERGAATAGRQRPPLVAHALAARTTDRAALLAAAREQLAYYAAAPFYARMWADAGFPLEGGAVSDALIEALTVWGDDDAIAAGLRARLDQGVDELLVSPIFGEDRDADFGGLIGVLGGMAGRE
ncbi:MAG: hypothetical protein AVDCRST_MAG73-292 [uncultured Thermomicrobiales bacterium]|uniref:Luciferase-like domain-containing protein n=1 Tax=uncultured Thermomicrobiales bacterium TaxID=1645740 RepID=A0A6J4TJ34_9BACT|nr:MAG: hypothetical protein AVDCRST_MAG73-292 [uncultured Thermomicrobiales bacterium]